MKYHKSVFLDESIEALRIKKGKKYIDATLGEGGHTNEIIKLGGIVLGLDADLEAINFVKKKHDSRIKNHELQVVKANFRNIEIIAREMGFKNVAGILFDFGVSSRQIDQPKRGFSYLKSGPLDMRMDQELGVKASDLVNALGKDELIKLFSSFADEYRAKDISERIIRKRQEKPLETTDELVGLLAQSYKFKDLSDFARAKSSKKVFQALRIAVNDELEAIRESLPNSLKVLERGGRLVVITFHSLEDRTVKKIFKDFEKKGKGKIITKKPITPSAKEIKENSRSKSAKLRVFEKN